MSTPVAIALGSNLGNRGTHIDWAVSRLREVVDGLRISTIRETEFAGSGTQPAFLNAVVVGHTDLAPRDCRRSSRARWRPACSQIAR